ncbi:MAG: HAD family hydrolase [Anaerolineaceae bacterium]|nr:HAD family hydrolase [Anaerolineaceae bacterium]
MIQEIEAVFLDLGNTLRKLTQNDEHQAKARQRIVELVGTDESPESFLEKLDQRYKVYRKWAFDTMREAPESELWTRWLAFDFPAERIGPLGTELTYQYRQSMGLRVVVEHGKDVVQTLYDRGYTLGIISNLITTSEIPEWMEADGFTPYFKSVALSSVLGIRKPDPAIYHIAAQNAGVDPSRCAYVGDNLKRDVTGTRAAGFGITIILTSPEALAEATITDENRPDLIIHQITDLLDIFPSSPKVNLDGRFQSSNPADLDQK